MTENDLLGDVAEITSSKRIFYKEYEKGGVPFLRSKEIIEKAAGKNPSTELFISAKRFAEITKQFGSPREGDILLTSVGTLGIPYKVEAQDRFYFKDGNLTWLRKFRPDLNSKFLYYWLTSKAGKNELENHTIVSTQKALTIQGLKKVKLPLPDLKQQELAVGMLDSIDQRIAMNRRMNETLEKSGQVLFKHYFIDNPDRKNWGVREIGQLFDLRMGLSPKGYSYNKDGIGSPLLNGAADFIGSKISPKQYTSAPTRISKVGDIIFCIRGTIGNVVIGYEENCIGRGVAAMTPKKNATSYVYFSTIQAIDKMKSAASGSVIKGLSTYDISDRKTEVPSERALENYEKQAFPIIEHLRINSEEMQTLITLRDSLLPRLISGMLAI